MTVLAKAIATSINNAEKLQLLTCAPQNWPVLEVSKLLNVSTYLVNKSLLLFAEKGLMSLPDQKKGKAINEFTIKLVI